MLDDRIEILRTAYLYVPKEEQEDHSNKEWGQMSHDAAFQDKSTIYTFRGNPVDGKSIESDAVGQQLIGGP